MATPRLYGEELEDPSYLEDPGAVEKAVSRMVEDLRSVKKSLKIYAGEAYWIIFDDPRVLSRFRELAGTGVKVQIVVGPALSAGGSKGSPHVLDLAREGLIEFYSRPTRGNHPHFRILDDEDAIVQPRHVPLQPLHLREKPDHYTRADNPAQFQAYVEEFERYTQGQKPVSNPEQEFVVLRSSELRQIADLAEKSYDELNKSDIEGLLREVHKRSEQKKRKVIEATEMWEQAVARH